MNKKRKSLQEILHYLQTAEFHELEGVAEDHEIEAKSAPYMLSSDRQKHELAKDVSALANASGGVILIGFRTEIDPQLRGERIVECRPFDQTLVDANQVRNILHDWIYPPIENVQISWYESAGTTGKGVVAIWVPAEAAAGRPYVVCKTIDSDDRISGTLIGFYERVQDGVIARSPQLLRTHLKDGLRFVELNDRLDNLEQSVAVVAPDNKPLASLFGKPHEAPSARIVSDVTLSLADIESGVAAYQLLGRLYSQFGFDYKQMPYLDPEDESGRITPKSLLGADWKS